MIVKTMTYRLIQRHWGVGINNQKHLYLKNASFSFLNINLFFPALQ